MRIREWGIRIGTQQTGARNGITDISGVRVGNVSLIKGEGPLKPGVGPIRTGVTAVWPAEGDLFRLKVPAAVHIINGFTKCIGLTQIAEMGTIETPVLITNTLNAGKCSDALIEYLYQKKKWDFRSINAVVTECNDSYLNDIAGRHVQPEHVSAALENAHNGNVEEGNAGAGTGMSCYGFKGGIGSSSRKIGLRGDIYHLGTLVCTNMGRAPDLKVNGLGIEAGLQSDRAATKPSADQPPGSIIVLIATDAPLDCRQLERTALRATHGLARTGTHTDSGSGDVVIAWTSSHRIPADADRIIHMVPRLNDEHLGPFFQAAADCTEESILNALWMAETMVGRDGNVREKIPLDRVRAIMNGFKSEQQRRR